jgi:hypothetical protein
MTALSPAAGRLDVGDTWLLTVLVTDDTTGLPVEATVTAEVTLPDESTAAPAVEQLTTGVYRAAHVLTQPGRHIGEVTATGAVVAVELFAVTAETPNALPDLAEVKNYLGTSVTVHHDDATIQDALDAETAAQAKVCRIGAVYSFDLRQALKRRVQRNLAMRQLPLAVLQGDAEVGDNTVLPGMDPEVRRFERPYRKVVVA